ncbi:MAG: hypothetical protein VW644_01145 [Alphaproteobacteria bacterium]|jgi:hypothetical protein
MRRPSAGTSLPDLGTLCQIDWNRHSRERQQTMVNACMRPTLPQSPVYAAALKSAGHADFEFGLMRFHRRPVGYVFVEKRPFIRWVSSNRIYRGPIWLESEIPGTVQQ